MTRQITPYSKEYRDRIFVAWYSAGRPKRPKQIMELIPLDEHGRKPHFTILNRFINMDRWHERADELDAKANAIVESNLIENKVRILKKQAEDSIMLASKAHEHLLVNGFDSSASAVQAYFKATEEQRTVIGLSEILSKLGKMTDDDLMTEIQRRIARASESGQIIDADDVEDVGEVEDQDSGNTDE